MNNISATNLLQLIQSDQECALIDVREQGSYSQGHLLFAVCIPLGHLELQIENLVPRKTTQLILMDDPAEAAFAERAAAQLHTLGYTDIHLLKDGILAWRDAGFELFSGINVPSKAFGEFIEHTYDTPRLEAAAVKKMLDENHDMVVVDSRPYAEFHRMNIPTGVDMPGAELALRIHDVAPDPDTLVVVNCAGRTRSIIGAQSLINTGISNRVVALKDGTMGWHLAGFELEHGAERVAPLPGREGAARAAEAATRVAQRFGVQRVKQTQVDVWLAESDRSTFCLDVRSPAEYTQVHLPGYRNAPGGQLVQATDEYVAVRNARIVLSDDDGVRAIMTASWLIQMGWSEVYVLAGTDESEWTVNGPWPTSEPADLPDADISPATLQAELDDVTVIDLGPSPAYESAHIPGAIWCVRSRLDEALVDRAHDRIVFTSPDGLLARYAVRDVSERFPQVRALQGGTERWLAEGRPTASGLEHLASPTDDVWYKPYDHRGQQEKFMREYLTWEVALVEQIARDGTTNFKSFAG